MTTARGLLLALTCALVTGPVTVAALDKPAVLTILTPTQAQEISGHISFWAASDGVEGVTSLRFQVDGKDYGEPIKSGLYRVTWDSRQATDGLHTVQAIGQDKYGNTLLSSPVTFFVNNFAPLQPIPQPAPEPVQTQAAPPPAPVATPLPSANGTNAAPPASAPVTTSAPAAASAPSTRTVAVSCKQPDPFKTVGGIGMCVGGEWVLLWKPKKKN